MLLLVLLFPYLLSLGYLKTLNQETLPKPKRQTNAPKDITQRNTFKSINKRNLLRHEER